MFLKHIGHNCIIALYIVNVSHVFPFSRGVGVGEEGLGGAYLINFQLSYSLYLTKLRNMAKP